MSDEETRLRRAIHDRAREVELDVLPWREVEPGLWRRARDLRLRRRVVAATVAVGAVGAAAITAGALVLF